MICDQVQADLSRGMDEDVELPSESSRHLSICPECAEFRETSMDVARRYGILVRAGIDRLRGLNSPRPAFSARKRWLVPLAAAVLLCWWGAEPQPAASPVVVVSPAPTRIWPVDEEGLSFISVRDLLPVRLHDEFLPAPPSVSEIALPRDLRF